MLGDTCTPPFTPFSFVHSSDAQGTSVHYFQSTNPTTLPVVTQQQSSNTDDFLRANSSQNPFIERIPNEILSLIFELGYLDAEEPDSCFRTLIEKISRKWREVSHHTPLLWSIYHLSQGNIDTLIDNLPKFLERSGDHPLNISLNCFWDPAQTEEVLGHFLPHSRRWRFLSVTTPGLGIFRHLHNIPVPQLETLAICHFSSQRHLSLDPMLFNGQLPSLRHLALRNMTFKDTTLPFKGLYSLDIRGYGIWPDHAELNKLIGGSATLRRLTLHVRAENTLRDMDRQENPPIILPVLRTFDVITSEWLSPHVATLSRAFSCPSMDSFIITDNSTSATVSSYDIVHYFRTGFVSHPDAPALRVRSCDLYYAWHCLNHSRTVTTLELDDIHWPHWSNVTTVLVALPSLENIIITNVDPTAALSDLGEPKHLLKIVSLRKLEVGTIRRKLDIVESDLARFIDLFEAPKLQLLAVRNISSEQWKHILVSFIAKVEKYPLLESLSVAHLQGLPDSYPDPSLAFPNLRSLALIKVSVNTIIQRLVIPPPTSYPIIPWPKLTRITICGDPLASVPLLHRIIYSRPRGSLSLYLDPHFQRNLESWGWLEENADVVLISG